LISKNTSDYNQLSVDETFALLNSSRNGLPDIEAKARIEEFGRNEIPEKKRNSLVEFLSRYWGPLPWLLELTIALSYLLNRFLETIIIFSLLTTNALIGFHHARSYAHTRKIDI
jgi:H+-transporting ATPase